VCVRVVNVCVELCNSKKKVLKKMSLVTSGISRSAGAQSFGGAHRDRVCVRVLWNSGKTCHSRNVEFDEIHEISFQEG
jgi:hypothetical protein